MTRFGYVLLGFSLLHAGVEGSFRYREGVLQLPLMLLYPVWFGLLLASFARLRWHSLGARLGSTALLLWFVASPFIGARGGIALRDAVFRSRLPEYEAVVQTIQAGNMPPVIPRLAYRIVHHATPAGDLEVIFFWGAGFPVKHTAFVYCESDPRTDPNFQQAWRSARPLAPNWYLAKD